MEFTGRDVHLVKKALAIAALSISQLPGSYQRGSDITDITGLPGQLIASDVEVNEYVHGTRIFKAGFRDPQTCR